jgi:hypothetical protein
MATSRRLASVVGFQNVGGRARLEGTVKSRIERQARDTTNDLSVFFIDDVQSLYTRGTATMPRTQLFEGAFRLCRFPCFGNRPCGISGDYYLINI